MSILPQKYRLLGWISLLLTAGFVTMTTVNYFSSVQYLQHTLSNQTLPLIGDNIYSEIDQEFIRPVLVSAQMAHDVFLRDWILDGEREPGQIQRYLQEVADHNDTMVSFLASDRSRIYYNQSGIHKKISANEPRDAWFFRVRMLTAPYEINVVPDLANRNATTIFVNYRVLDYQDRFIGATGVGITTEGMGQLLHRYQQQYQRQIYFIDAKGNIVLSSRPDLEAAGAALAQLPGIGTIAADILASDSARALSYQLDGDSMQVNARRIPELGWYLVIEQSEQHEMHTVRYALWMAVGIGVLVTAAVLLLIWLAVSHYHNRLELLVTTDSLTGCLNRRAIELMLGHAVADYRRGGRPFSLLLCDIDFFKLINDRFGHDHGDLVLRLIGKLLGASLRENDLIARWGGEEFMVLLPGTVLDDAIRVAESLRKRVAEEDFKGTSVTVSIGVAQQHHDDTAHSLFKRADMALYLAKRKGRNRTEHEPSGAGTTRELPA